MGSRLVFVREASCGPDLIISPDRGVNVVFQSSKINVPYVFEDIGEFSIFCNGPGETAIIAACIDVFDPALQGLEGNVIPTVGEWGVVILLLLILICAVVSFRHVSEIKPAYLKK